MDRDEVREIFFDLLNEEFPEKYCPVCEGDSRMAKFWKWDKVEKTDRETIACLTCGTKFTEKLERV